MPTETELTPVHRERIAEWVAALRSGKYTQIKGRLKSGSGHCCLGVACEIYAKHEGKDIEKVIAGYETMPNAVCEWFGVPDANPKIAIPLYGKKDGHAAAANDSSISFQVIADAIEKTYLPHLTSKKEQSPS